MECSECNKHSTKKKSQPRQESSTSSSICWLDALTTKLLGLSPVANELQQSNPVAFIILILIGTQIFSLSHARHILNIPPFCYFFSELKIYNFLYYNSASTYDSNCLTQANTSTFLLFVHHSSTWQWIIKKETERWIGNSK